MTTDNQYFIRILPKSLDDSSLSEGDFVKYQKKIYKFDGWEYGHYAILRDLDTNEQISIYR